MPYGPPMNQVSGTYRNGAVILDEPVDWPEGMHVRIAREDGKNANARSVSTGPGGSLVEDRIAFEPIPVRPPGYFTFDQEDVELDKKFASANVVPDPDQE